MDCRQVMRCRQVDRGVRDATERIAATQIRATVDNANILRHASLGTPTDYTTETHSRDRSSARVAV